VNDAGKVICRDHPNNPPSSGGFALVVLEGSSVTKVSGPDGITVDVMPGQMAVVGPKGSGAPTVYAVNITQIARTSPLINAFPNPLPSLPQIISTAYNLQGQNIGFTGTSGAAISSRGQLLTVQSPPPNPFVQTFLMAHNQPGQNNSGNFNNNLANIATAAGGGGGGPSTPSGVAPTGGGGFAGPNVPTTPTTPNNNGQQAVAGNRTPISATATVAPKVYDGTTAALVTGATLTGSPANVSLANATTGTFASPNVGTGISVTTGMTLTGSGASLYSFTAPVLTGTITAKDLSVFNAMVAPKVYDGTDSAVITSAVLLGNSTGPSDGKYIGSEVVSLSSATSGTFADKNVGIGKGVSTMMTLGGADAGNYTLFNQPTLTGTITAKNITMSSSTINKVYDGTTAAAVTLGTLSGLVGAEQLQVSVLGGAGTFSSSNVGGSSSISVTYQLADDLATGGLVSNYNLLNATETLMGTISAKNLSVFNAAVTTKVYDGTDSAVVTGAVLVGNSSSDTDGKFISNEAVTLGAGTSGTFADRNVGTGKTVTTTMTLSGAGAGNYTLSTQPTLTGAISKKNLQIGGMSVAASKVYDGTTATVLL
ncbi:hypothetical protein EBT23_06695, partial [bacterium]|nr:hypothetical protein [bacterium]